RGQGPAHPRRGQPAQGPGDGLAGQGGLRRRELRHRGRVRGDVDQAEGLRRARAAPVAGGDPGHEHLLAVDQRDGLAARAPRAGRGLPLLQPGPGAAAAGDP
ncbi:hypothetical protein AN648_15130, partial [Listeria monocytogenes]